jgi:protein tyrosine/serine phosphatase
MTRRRRVALVVVIAVVAVAGGALLWDGVLRDRLVPRRFAVVEEGSVYRSGQLSRHLVRDVLEEHGIRTVVDLTSPVPGDPDQEAEARTLAELGVAWRRFPLAGNGTGDPEHYVLAIEAVEEARRGKRPVLVHCTAGSQRTGGVLACWRTLVLGWPVDRAVEEMRRHGFREDRNPALLPFLNEHLDRIAEGLRERGVIERAPEPLPRFPE